MQFFLTKLLCDLHHVRRDTRGAHKPRNAPLPTIALRAPFPNNAEPRLEQAHQPVIRRVQEPVPLLHPPDVSLGLAREAVQARGARPNAARVEPEHVELPADDRRDVLPLARDEVRAGPARTAWVHEHGPTVVSAVPRRDHAQRDRGLRPGWVGGEVVEGEEEPRTLLAVVAGCPVDIRGGLELDGRVNGLGDGAVRESEGRLTDSQSNSFVSFATSDMGAGCSRISG